MSRYYVRCWGCVLTKWLPVNTENILKQSLKETPINDWGICLDCGKIPVRIMKNRITKDTIGERFIKSWCDGEALSSNSTLTYIINWKTDRVYSPRIFIGMCDHWITPYMLEHYSLDEIKKHCLEMATKNTEEWEFYKKLNSYTTDEDMKKLFAVKIIGENVVLEYDENAHSLEPVYAKQLTKLVFQ